MGEDYEVIEDGGFDDYASNSDCEFYPKEAGEEEAKDAENDDIVEIINDAASNGEFIALGTIPRVGQSDIISSQTTKTNNKSSNKVNRRYKKNCTESKAGDNTSITPTSSHKKDARLTSSTNVLPYSIFSKVTVNPTITNGPQLNVSGDEYVTINFPVCKMQSQQRLYIEALQSAINKNWSFINAHPDCIDLALELGMKAARDELINGKGRVPATTATNANSDSEIYHTLESLNRNVERVNIYVVALEMIQTVNPNSTSNYFHTINYKVTDPSVFNNEKFAKVDFSLQLKFKLHPGNGINCEEKDCNCHFHISAGDIIRARRVKVKYNSDNNNFVHVTSIRLWNLDKEDFNILYNGINTTITDYDLERVQTLKGFAKRILSENELLCISSYMNTLDNISTAPQDYLCFVKYAEKDSIYVIDRPDQAPVRVTFSLLIAKNVLESKNPISPGDWIKLRSFRRPLEPGKTIGPCLSCSDIARITRLWEGCKEVVTLKEYFAKSNEYFRVDSNVQPFRSIGMPSYIKRQRYSSRSGNLIDRVENTRPSLISEATKFSSVFPTDGVHQFPVKLTGLKRMNKAQSQELEEGEIVL